MKQNDINNRLTTTKLFVVLRVHDGLQIVSGNELAHYGS